jgi:hypothetical protein
MLDSIVNNLHTHGPSAHHLARSHNTLCQAFGASWRPCGADSLFLPGTQKFEVARLGFR